MYKYIILIFFSLIFLEPTTDIYEKLPNHYLKDLDNNKRNIYDFLNDGPAAISFWFLACEPCKKEMVYLDEYNQKYAKYGFKVVSINTDNSRTFNRVKPFVNSKKYSFTVLSDPKSLFFRKTGGQICPYLILVDDTGNIINKHIGYNPGDEIKLEGEIVNMLINQIKSDTTLVDSSIIKIINNKILEKENLIENKE